MVRRAADVLNPVPFQFLLKLGLAVPTGILTPVVRQHLLGRPMRAHATPENLHQVIRRLAPEEFQRRDVAGVVVDEPDQVGIAPGPQPLRRAHRFPSQLEGKEVALPHLVGRGALEKARLRRVARRLLRRRFDQLGAMQCLAHRLRAGRQVEDPSQGLRYAVDPKRWMFPLERCDLLANERSRRRFGRR